MSKLYVVPTPIGHLKDITFRAIEVLQSVDLILSEDTRTSGKLLTHYDIQTPMRSYHMHNEGKVVQQLVAQMVSGISMALISDAGTPSISDPGFLLVRECLKAEVGVECLPGATAFVPALVNSGLPNNRFAFEGFLPIKKGRKKRLTELGNEERTLIFYESPHRLVRTLEDFIKIFGLERKASVSRELTKIHEETKRGSLAELYEYFSGKNIKGELVIIIDGADAAKKAAF